MDTHKHNELSVDERVVLELTASEAINPRQAYGWWKELMEDHPTLANEVRRRAYYDTIGSEHLSPFELYTRDIDLVVFVAKALKLIRELEERGDDETSAGNTNSPGDIKEPLSDGVDGEDPPLSV